LPRRRHAVSPCAKTISRAWIEARSVNSRESWLAVYGARCSILHHNYEQGISQCLRQQAQGVSILRGHQQIQLSSCKSPSFQSFLLHKHHQGSSSACYACQTTKVRCLPLWTCLSVALRTFADLSEKSIPTLHRNYQQCIGKSLNFPFPRRIQKAVSTFRPWVVVADLPGPVRRPHRAIQSVTRAICGPSAFARSQGYVA
jgi:hypothetical protein